MEFAYPLAALSTIIIALVLFMFSAQVGAMRGKHGIEAPATTGHEAFDRAFRIHMNSIEQVVLFLPLMWLFAMLVSDLYAGIAAAVWVAGRILYSRNYMRDPSTRSVGFVTSLLALATALIWSLVEVIMILL